MIRSNPYSLHRTWDDDTRAAYASMPTNRAGTVVGLPHTPDKDVPAAETAWREWAKRTPRHLWPVWMDSWADVKKARGLE